MPFLHQVQGYVKSGSNSIRFLVVEMSTTVSLFRKSIGLTALYSS